MLIAPLLALLPCLQDVPLELPLWPDGVPETPAALQLDTSPERADDPNRHVRGLYAPTISVYPAAPSLQGAPAIVICPGGGYGVLAIDKEGHEVARWLQSNGVTGVVLKYRLPRQPGHTWGTQAPLADAHRALGLVREHASEWNVDPGRVGVMGFSAGGHLAGSASTLLGDEGPNFSVLVYPVLSLQDGVTHHGSRNNLLGDEQTPEQIDHYSAELQADANTPPAFLVHTLDDGAVPYTNSTRYVDALHAAGVSAELHLYEKGGHGYGMRRPNLPVGAWPGALLSWMRSRALLAPSHAIFYAGPDFTGILGERGETIWDSGRAGARDGWVLENGNVLIAWANEVRELPRSHASVFHYALAEPNSELGTCQRLPSGNTLITELGASPRILEVAPNGNIEAVVALQPETDNAHMQTRMARKLDNGNYLVPHLLAFAVKEYAPSGEVVHTLHTDLGELGGRAAENWPFTAIRLPNGNTLVGLTHGNKAVEFAPDGSVVWSISNDDLPGNPIDDACGVQRLPNGNTVVTAYHAQGTALKLLEVDRDKRVVWSSYAPQRAHHFQVLSTNGRPLAGAPMR